MVERDGRVTVTLLRLMGLAMEMNEQLWILPSMPETAMQLSIDEIVESLLISEVQLTGISIIIFPPFGI